MICTPIATRFPSTPTSQQQQQQQQKKVLIKSNLFHILRVFFVIVVCGTHEHMK